MTDHGEDTWAFLQRHPDYRAAWLEHGRRAGVRGGAVPGPGAVAGRSGRGGALEPARLGGCRRRRGRPCLAVLGRAADAGGDRVAARAAALLPLLEEAGATVAGLRLRDGLLVLRIAQGGAAVQLLVECDRPFTAEDGLRVFLDVDLRLSVRIGQLRDLWNVVGGPVPRRGRVRGAGLGKY